MKKYLLGVILWSCFLSLASAQSVTNKFGKGIQLIGKDSTYFVKTNVRFQNLMINSWSLPDDSFSDITDHENSFLVRRARLKFGGWAYSTKLKYKMELGLTNRDIGNGDSDEFNQALLEHQGIYVINVRLT